MMDRRNFLNAGILTAAGALIVPARAAEAPATLSLSLNRSAQGPLVPRDFVGLSYETQQLETPDFFNAHNRPLVRAFRDLAPAGILRIGGNTSEFSWWKERPGDKQPPRIERPIKPGQPRSDLSYAVTPAAIDALKGFLHATNWRCIYGLNLGNGIPADLAREAAYVQWRLGKRLVAFVIGNEVDVFSSHLRDPKSWSPDTYLAEWLAAAHAITTVSPDARFILPDVAYKLDWLTTIADRWASIKNPPRIEALSHHFYKGSPYDPRVKPDRLLLRSTRESQEGKLTSDAARKMGVAYRMTEGNTAFHGGKPGVSDSYVAALWAADYMLQLMSLGYSGVNLHGGAGPAVANSVGGLAGEKMLPDAQPRPRPFYTPIGNMDGQVQPQPVYWGMKFAGLFSGARMRTVQLDAQGLNVVAYSADTAQGTLLAILNKEIDTDVRLPLPRHQSVATLSGPSLDSREARLDLTSRSVPAGAVDIVRSSATIVRLSKVVAAI